MTGRQAGLAELAALLSRRIAEGRFEPARDALADYCRKLHDTAACLPPGDLRQQRLYSEFRDLFEETRRQVLAGRAHLALRLARLPPTDGSLPYTAASAPRRTWEYLG